MWSYRYSGELYHYGVKGMKWGVRRTKEQLGHKKSRVEKAEKAGIIKETIYGHQGTPKQASPNSIIDHVGNTGKIDVRSFYSPTGWKNKDIHATDHGNPKRHPFGKNGEHVNVYDWNEDGSIKSIKRRELTHEERKGNEDIL
jgi:hypothetical protein